MAADVKVTGSADGKNVEVSITLDREHTALLRARVARSERPSFWQELEYRFLDEFPKLRLRGVRVTPGGWPEHEDGARLLAALRTVMSDVAKEAAFDDSKWGLAFFNPQDFAATGELTVIAVDPEGLGQDIGAMARKEREDEMAHAQRQAEHWGRGCATE